MESFRSWTKNKASLKKTPHLHLHLKVKANHRRLAHFQQPDSLASKFERASALGGRKRTTAGNFSLWYEGGWRGAGPWHRGAYAGSRGHSRQGHCLYCAPIAWPQVFESLQALRWAFVAHVEPQGLVGLAVVYNRLLVAIEGQRTHLVGDLIGGTEKRSGGKWRWRRERWRGRHTYGGEHTEMRIKKEKQKKDWLEDYTAEKTASLSEMWETKLKGKTSQCNDLRLFYFQFHKLSHRIFQHLPHC